MSSTSALVVARPGTESFAMRPAGGELIASAELRHWVRSGKLLRHLFRHRSVQLVTPRVSALPNPLQTMALIRLLTLGSCSVVDGRGGSLTVTIRAIAGAAARYATDALRRNGVISKATAALDGLRSAPKVFKATQGALPIAYFRTDLWFGVDSGGSVAHTSGVVNALADVTGVDPIVFVTEPVPGVKAIQHLLPVPTAFWDFPEVPTFAANQVMVPTALKLIGAGTRAIYHRYSLNSFVGASVAQRIGVPLILEYNGSETWINRHWGRPLRYEAESSQIEIGNLNLADLIVVVSEASRDELVSRQIDPSKILVNPNGVDPDMYSPSVSGEMVRARYDLDGKVVVGFIGTFGPWHGAEVLADAFGMLLNDRPELRESVRLLLIGDGLTRPDVESRLAAAGVLEESRLTGRTKQSEGPEHLAASDILVSPHVPNPDGTPFFGSPTKLFEYMAMGRPIVASRLAQIGELLEDERTALLVEPGNAADLASAIGRLVDDRPLRGSLGEQARAEAVRHYTWEQHTRRILDRLALVGSP